MAEALEFVRIAPMEKPRSTVRVLIADDSAPVRERLAAMLWEIPNVDVVAETADVRATAECLIELLPDLVLLDISMPGGSGFEILDVIRDRGLPTIAVVVTTHVEPEFESRARDLGAAAFFNKSRDFVAATEFVRNFSQQNGR
jgi:DNA-binding NarL/FixJ family response regulator